MKIRKGKRHETVSDVLLSRRVRVRSSPVETLPKGPVSEKAGAGTSVGLSSGGSEAKTKERKDDEAQDAATRDVEQLRNEWDGKIPESVALASASFLRVLGSLAVINAFGQALTIVHNEDRQISEEAKILIRQLRYEGCTYADLPMTRAAWSVISGQKFSKLSVQGAQYSVLVTPECNKLSDALIRANLQAGAVRQDHKQSGAAAFKVTQRLLGDSVDFVMWPLISGVFRSQSQTAIPSHAKSFCFGLGCFVLSIFARSPYLLDAFIASTLPKMPKEQHPPNTNPPETATAPAASN